MVLLNLDALERQNENIEKIEKIKENIQKSQIRDQLKPKKFKPMRAISNGRSKPSFENQIERFNIQKLIQKTKEEDVILTQNYKELSSNLINIINEVITIPHTNRQKFKGYVEGSTTMQNIIKREIENYSMDNLSDRSVFGLLYASYYSKAMF